MSQRVMCDQSSYVRQLSRFRLEKFLARGNIEEEITNRDHRPLRNSGLFYFEQFAAGYLHSGSGPVLGCAGLEQEPGNRCNGWQCLTAKSQGRNSKKIVNIVNLRGCMTLKGQHGVVLHHSTA